MFCNSCGKEIDDKAQVCVHCGAPVKPEANQVTEGSGFGWGILGFIIPIVGFVLYFVWKEKKPKSAKAAMIGAIISVALGIIGNIFLFR